MLKYGKLWMAERNYISASVGMYGRVHEKILAMNFEIHYNCEMRV